MGVAAAKGGFDRTPRTPPCYGPVIIHISEVDIHKRLCFNDFEGDCCRQDAIAEPILVVSLLKDERSCAKLAKEEDAIPSRATKSVCSESNYIWSEATS